MTRMRSLSVSRGPVRGLGPASVFQRYQWWYHSKSRDNLIPSEKECAWADGSEQ